MTFTFTGRDVAWFATKTSGSGRAGVYLDGKYQRTVDLHASTTQYQQLAFGAHLGLASHEHPVLGDGRVDVDAFVVNR